MKTAFVFPGQGSQYAGMGRDVFEKHPSAREIFERADEALGFSISKICFEGTEDELKLTANTQPAILTASVAVYSAMKKIAERAGKELKFACVAGHSLGEYSAAVVAGAIRFEDAVRAVRIRGEAMQSACPVGEGAMSAIIGLSPEAVQKICDEEAKGEILAPANINSREQIVVAGHKSAAERASERAKKEGAKMAKFLPVSAPFHCALMKPAKEKMSEILQKIEFRNPVPPIVSNVTGRAVKDGGEERNLLIEQITAPVKWLKIMECMAEHHIERVVEIGPGRVLTGLQKRTFKDTVCVNIEKAEDMELFVKSL